MSLSILGYTLGVLLCAKQENDCFVICSVASKVSFHLLARALFNVKEFKLLLPLRHLNEEKNESWQSIFFSSVGLGTHF